MNTPNPNPSPELLSLAKRLYWTDVKYGDKDGSILDEWQDGWWDTNVSMPLSGPPFLARWLALAQTALTPPIPAETVTVALPGAGEELYRHWNDERGVYEYASKPLATVAAANDEGVADDHGRVRQEAHVRGWKHGLEDAAKVADGVAEGAQSLYDLAARDRDTVGTLIHGEAVRVAKHLAAAIRLLSQGGGKA